MNLLQYRNSKQKGSQNGSSWKGLQWIIWPSLPAQAGSSQSTRHKIVFRQFLNIFSEGDSKPIWAWMKVAMALHFKSNSKILLSISTVFNFGLGYFLFEKDTPSGVIEFHHYSTYLLLFWNFLTKITCVSTVSIWTLLISYM